MFLYLCLPFVGALGFCGIITVWTSIIFNWHRPINVPQGLFFFFFFFWYLISSFFVLELWLNFNLWCLLFPFVYLYFNLCREQRVGRQWDMRELEVLPTKNAISTWLVDPMRLVNLLCRIAFIVYNNLYITQVLNF